MDIDRQLLNRVIQISGEAGRAILEIYHDEAGFSTQAKDDNSPVTEADHAAHAVIAAALPHLLTGVPLLSEESSVPDFQVRSGWQTYWLVDPLDGTKEFIKRNGEFTVNIALIHRGVPILGVVHVPVSGTTYAGGRGLGAFRIDSQGERPIGTSPVPSKQGHPLRVVASRSHGSEEVERCIDRLQQHFGLVERRSMGSSLKLCLVAEGQADIYPRLAPTSEWDTAAAHAVVEAAGGIVLDEDLKRLTYNSKADLLNPYFYVIGDLGFDWSKLLA
jgi:3'(2'), 5'-bisphosphate nucleotidase